MVVHGYTWMYMVLLFILFVYTHSHIINDSWKHQTNPACQSPFLILMPIGYLRCHSIKCCQPYPRHSVKFGYPCYPPTLSLICSSILDIFIAPLDQLVRFYYSQSTLTSSKWLLPNMVNICCPLVIEHSYRKWPKHGDFPVRYLKLPEGNIITPQSQQPGTLGTFFFTTPQVFPCHNHQSIGSQASTGDGAGDHHDAHHGFPPSDHQVTWVPEMGIPNSWLVYFMENPNLKSIFRTGATSISGNLHMVMSQSQTAPGWYPKL